MSASYEPGTKVLGRYLIERLLGEGGMGSVYVARHAELSRKQFAVKTLRPDLFGMDEIEQRFRREADLLASLNHPGIVSIVDYGMDGRTPVMVMELLEGETLRDRLGKIGRLPIDETLRVVREVASALDYTHHAQPPIIHRDLKPENLFLVSPDDRVKVLDFGIAKAAGEGNLTRTSMALGTPSYMSPEQLRDSKSVEPSTDVFALASIAFECLTATLAFPGEGIAGVVLAMFDRPRPEPSTIRNDVPPAVDGVFARAWAIDTTRRPPSAGEFASELAAAFGAAPRTTGVSSSAVASSVDLDAQHTTPLAPSPVPATRAIAGPLASTHTPPPAIASVVGARGGRTGLWIGGSLAGLAVMAVAAFAFTHGPAPTTRPATAATAVAPPSDPTLPPDQRHVPTEPLLPGLGDPATPHPHTGPRDVFDVVRETLDAPVRNCAGGGESGERFTVRVAWGADGYPTNVNVDRELPPTMRACVSEAVAQFGRIPPQAQGAVTRTLTFTRP